MIGIAGIYHLQTAKPVDPARLRSMVNAPPRRGRGEAAEWTAPGVGLGALNPQLGDGVAPPQPLLSDDGTVAIVFDGLLLNRAGLRAELDMLGHRLATGSDAELVLAAWRQWGAECLTRLEGLFAIALHDHGRSCLFLARDRMGARPLHMALLADGALVFASQIKALLRHPLLQRQPNLTAAEDFLALGYVPDDNCLLAGVEKLAAGHYLLLQRGKPVLGPQRWWSPDFSRRARVNEVQAADYLAQLLRHIVRDYSAAEPANGLFLSGGLDSSALLALMAETRRDGVKSLTLRSGQGDGHQQDAVRLIGERFAADYRSFAAPAAASDMIDTVADALDEPCADLDIPWMLALATEASGEWGAAMLGHGAEEIFAGCRRMVFHHQEERMRARVPDIVRRAILGPLSRALPVLDGWPVTGRAKIKLSSLAQSGTQAYARAVAQMGPARRVRILNDAAVRALDQHIGEGRYWHAMAGAPAREPLDRAQFADWTIALPGQMLMKLDRIGSAANVALLAPFADHRVAELMMSLPASMRVKKDGGKAIFRRSMARYLPPSVVNQPRQRWEAPVSLWFRSSLSDEARRLSVSQTLSHTGWFDMAEMSALVAAHQAGRADHGLLIWQMLLLEKSLSRLFNI